MARRTGIVKEFEFKPIGENHNQGVSVHLDFTGNSLVGLGSISYVE